MASGPADAPAAAPAAPAEPKLWEDEPDEFAQFRGRVERSYIFEERLDAGRRLKEAGNAMLNDGDYEDASAKYEEGLYHLDFDEFQRMELLDEHREALMSVRAPLLLNSVLCALRMNTADQTRRLTVAEARCDEVLRHDAQSSKARFRRAQLHSRAGEDEKAKAMLEALCRAHPSERAFRAELAAVHERLRAARRDTASFWSEAMRKQAERAGGEGADVEGGGGATSAAEEPCITHGLGPLARSQRARLAGAAGKAGRADSAAVWLGGPLGPLLGALRGLVDVGTAVWEWWGSMLWASTVPGAATPAEPLFGEHADAASKSR